MKPTNHQAGGILVRFLAVLVSSAVCIGPKLQAQDDAVTAIRDRSDACRGCSITLTSITTLVPPDTAPDLGPDSRVVVDRRGRFFVTSRDRRHVLRFSSAGRFEGEVGRPGQGPGEFQATAMLVVGPRDSLFVFQRGRIAVFTPDAVLARTAQVGANLLDAAMRPDGAVIAQMTINDPARIGYPLHIISPNGAITKSFGVRGEPRVVPNPQCSECAVRNLHVGAGGNRLWLTPRNRYEFSSWSPDGNFLRSFRVVGSRWFKDWDRDSYWYDGSVPVPTSILQIAEEATGNIWVLGTHPSPNARPLPPPAGSGLIVSGRGVAGRSRTAVQDYTFAMLTQNTEAVLEYIDLSRLQTVASTRMRGRIRLLGEGMAAKTLTDDEGVYRIEIHAVRLVRPST